MNAPLRQIYSYYFHMFNLDIHKDINRKRLQSLASCISKRHKDYKVWLHVFRNITFL